MCVVRRGRRLLCHESWRKRRGLVKGRCTQGVTKDLGCNVSPGDQCDWAEQCLRVVVAGARRGVNHKGERVSAKWSPSPWTQRPYSPEEVSIVVASFLSSSSTISLTSPQVPSAHRIPSAACSLICQSLKMWPRSGHQGQVSWGCVIWFLYFCHCRLRLNGFIVGQVLMWDHMNNPSLQGTSAWIVMVA